MKYAVPITTMRRDTVYKYSYVDQSFYSLSSLLSSWIVQLGIPKVILSITPNKGLL